MTLEINIGIISLGNAGAVIAFKLDTCGKSVLRNRPVILVVQELTNTVQCFVIYISND